MTRNLTSRLLFLSLTGALGFANWHAWSEPLSSPAAASVADVVEAPAAIGVPSFEPKKIAAIEDFKITLERPLFEANRRPAVTEPQKDSVAAGTDGAAEIGQSPISNLRVLGLMRTGAKPHRALVQLDDNSSAKWIEEGSTLGIWNIVEIDDERIVAANGGARQNFALHGSRAANK